MGGGHAVEASLGYYIYPLVSSVIGVVVFRERPVVLQVVAVLLGELAAVLALEFFDNAMLSQLILDKAVLAFI